MFESSFLLFEFFGSFSKVESGIYFSLFFFAVLFSSKCLGKKVSFFTGWKERPRLRFLLCHSRPNVALKLQPQGESGKCECVCERERV